MCTSIVEFARAEGMAKRGNEWFPLAQAVVAYDHARHAPLGNCSDASVSRPRRRPRLG